MKLIESFTIAKTGMEQANEDGYYIDNSFVAVIDGATSKKSGNIQGISSGRFAMQKIKEALKKVNPKDTPIEILTFINNFLKESVKSLDIKNLDTPAASILICNLQREEIILYGDCAYSVNGKTYKIIKNADKVLSQKRAEIIKNAINNGVSISEIRQNDIGRQAIINDLINQANNFANFNNQNGYPCINGTDIIESFIKIEKIKKKDEIIMCSDGYPVIENTLEKSEEKLKKLLKKDILCISELCSTKGVKIGDISFDDRTYLRFIV